MIAVLRTALVCLVLWTLLSPTARAGAQPVFPDGRVPSLAPLIEDVTPAVVNISVLSASPEEENPLMQDPFFRRFFGLPDKPEPRKSPPAKSARSTPSKPRSTKRSPAKAS